MKVQQKINQDLKSNLVSLCFHQLRNNMAILYSNAEIIEMKMEKVERTIRKSICGNTNSIKAEVDQIIELMSYMLDFGKHETTETTLNKQAIDIKTFIENIMLIYFDKNATKREVSLKVSGFQRNVFTDKLLLSQILINLISNALKYSEGQQDPLLKINYLETEVILEIVDFGIGISEMEKNTLFSPFYRCANTNGISGNGLGLFISKRFTEILKGDLKLESKEHTGTTIKLTFPYE